MKPLTKPNEAEADLARSCKINRPLSLIEPRLKRLIQPLRLPDIREQMILPTGRPNLKVVSTA